MKKKIREKNANRRAHSVLSCVCTAEKKSKRLSKSPSESKSESSETEMALKRIRKTLMRLIDLFAMMK